MKKVLELHGLLFILQTVGCRPGPQPDAISVLQSRAFAVILPAGFPLPLRPDPGVLTSQHPGTSRRRRLAGDTPALGGCRLRPSSTSAMPLLLSVINKMAGLGL